MDIKKIFINVMIVLCAGVVLFSVFTAVKRSTEPEETYEAKDELMRNTEIVYVSETETEADVPATEITDAENPTETLEDGQKVMYTTSKVNVRTGPATTYDKVVELPKESKVVCIGEADAEGWQKISYEDQEAYILSRYLTEEEPQTSTEPTTSGNVQSGNSTPSTGQTQQPAATGGWIGFYPQDGGASAAPTTPSEPATPSEPVTPTEPATPTTPSEPVTPTEPAAPMEPSEPATPTTPTPSTEPAAPATPSEPTASSEPNVQTVPETIEPVAP